MRKPFSLIIGIILVPIILPFLIKAGYEVMGYHAFVYDGETIAKIAQEKNDPSECSKIRVVFHPATTTYFEAQQCAFTLAQNIRDPAVCELLLPAEYGLTCLSSVGGKILQGIRCHELAGRSGLYCRGEINAELVAEKTQIGNCSLYTREDAIEWCHFARTYKLSGIHECSEMTNNEARDECETGYAFKQKDSSLCTAVQDEKRRKYCEIRINTWLKYPELRNSFYFGEPVPIQKSEN